VDQEKNRLTKRMLPFLMKPSTLLILTGTCILGEVMWMYLAIQNGSQWECLGLFIVGLLLGYVGGGWTSQLWDKYYIQALLGRVKLMRTSMGRRSTIFTVVALGVPMVMSFILASHDPFLPILQSYIFGFISGMNAAIYLWARRLPG
jgi:hypothetical protein